MISGRQALASIEGAVAQLRGNETELDAALRSATEEAARLRAERVEGFRQLARIRLDALSQESVVGELDAAERRALDLMERSRRSAGRLDEGRRATEAAVRRAEALRHARAEVLEQALDAIGDLKAAVEAKIGESAEWGAQRQRIASAVQTAEEAEKKAVQAEADREEKRKPYEADPLFMYLWNRRFGTAEYEASHFVRFLDRKVARLVQYDKARANYAMLNAIPQRLREHAERVKEEIAGERAELAEVERAELGKAGSAPLEARAVEAKAALDDAERALAAAKAAQGELDREHARLISDDPQGPYREAVELLAAADSRQDLQELYREAAQTPTREDEAILRRIEGAEAAIGRAEQEIGEIRQQMRGLAERRAALERERDEFRRRGYDNPWGSFGNEQNLGQILGGILGGVISSTVLRDAFRDNYRRRESPWDSGFGGGFPFPTGDRGGSSDGDSPFGDITDGIFGGGSDDGPSGGDGFRTGGTI